MRGYFVLLGLAIATDVSASTCDFYTPFGGSLEVPLGCPLIAYDGPDITGDPTALPAVSVVRAGQSIDVTGAIQIGSRGFDIPFDGRDENCEPTSGATRSTYREYTIELVGVQLGDQLVFRGASEIVDAGIVVDAAACPVPTVTPQITCTIDLCTQTEDPPDDESPGEAGGCSVGGTGGLGLIGALVLLRRRRR